ncbi:MAG TPA: Hsp70 family protein [Burkholderiales bacterium]|nr:Hsp70 family protein [Burkholderiales bacterium]
MAIIGIDLGTSNSAAAVLRGVRPVIIPSAEWISLGGKAFPSYVAVTADGQVIVGEPASRQASANPEGTATAFKRKMGRREFFSLRGKEFSPEQLSVFLLQKIRRDSESFLGEMVTLAVVTVPAYFDDNQRSAAKDACKIAGIDVARLFNEPAADMQTSVTVHVFQGERQMSRDNTSLGEFNLDGLPPAPRGIPKIEVTFDIDSNGILNVTAKDTATNKSQSIRISGSTRLSEAERERMIREAERYAGEDKERREKAEALNSADSVCHQGEQLLAEFSEKITSDLKNRMEAALREAREAIAKHDPIQAETKSGELKKLLQEAGAVIYSQSPGSGVYAQTPYRGKEGVVDAEYREA